MFYQSLFIDRVWWSGRGLSPQHPFRTWSSGDYVTLKNCGKIKKLLSKLCKKHICICTSNIDAVANRQAVKKKSFYKFQAWHYSAGEG